MEKLIRTLLACGMAMLCLNVDGQPQVTVKDGTLRGYEKNGIHIFKGIPFAAPPVGELRWKSPQPVHPWNGVRECTQNPPSAMQGKPVPFFCWSKEFLIPDEPISEDCLYLNVWSGAGEKEKRPVIVWIHGGGFSAGSGTVPLYDGEMMARKGVVFVTINYRLGVFGLLAHPELSAESPDKVSGNYGILDQIAALKWVKENIAVFGGDPENVTIDGQSAGAFSVNVLVVSPEAKGLFQKAIAESGGMFGKGNAGGQSLREAENAGAEFAKKAGVSSLAELRALPAEALMKIPGRWGVVIDNVIIPPVYETFASGKQNDVALLSGWNADDGVSFGPLADAAKFKSEISKQYGDRSEELLQLFPANTDEEAGKSQKLLSQLRFGWNNYTWARMQSVSGRGKAYMYYFTRVPPGKPDYGAFHSAEFGYALNTLKLWNRPFTERDYALADKMSSYWVNFARTGNPNGNGLPWWPDFNAKSPVVMELGDEVKAIPLPYQSQLKFLDKVNIQD